MTDRQIAIVRALQDGLPLSEDPFAEVADRAGVPVEELLAQIETWKNDGTIRRFGAILVHQRAGYPVNAMGVWNVPEDRIEDVGRAAAEDPSVSHCYQRPRFEGFDYNLYTMIHGSSREDCENIARRISERTGITDYRLLYTTAEYKKSGAVYFPSKCLVSRS
ncbi:MAG: Lrp/AsnC family transcriptional regulator [Armatimonadetes bacterium]|nr:Lrp/AsnC family transcriptional regulator [Armatimonadota bacterium]